jgi:hypothetical protein
LLSAVLTGAGEIQTLQDGISGYENEQDHEHDGSQYC